MDSKIVVIEELLKQGSGFTFANFCLPHGRDMRYGDSDTPEWLTWKTRALNIVKETASTNSAAANLAQIGFNTQTYGNGEDQFIRAKGNIISALQMSLDALKDDKYGELLKTTSESKVPSYSNKIFVVHGHDHLLKTELENFLTQIGLTAIVLHRQPDEGRTIIEKFEHHSDVGYAFILLTPDDVAYSKDQEGLTDDKRIKEIRARQNVIFEFGFFVGKLERKRVCCLYKGNVSLPSDLSGLVYKKIDGTLESKGLEIIKELKAAGYKITF